MELQALPGLEMASVTSPTHPSSFPWCQAAWGHEGAATGGEQSFVGCTCSEFPSKGDPVLGFGGCPGTSLCGLSKLEHVVCVCQYRQSCSVLCQEDALSAKGCQGSLHLSLEQLGLALLARRPRPARSDQVLHT